jgi:hypothetical protein
MLDVRLLAARHPKLRGLIRKVAMERLPSSDDRQIDEFADLCNMLAPDTAGDSYDMEDFCRRTGRDYHALAEKAARIEYEGRTPRWMAEAMAVLG